MASWVWDKPPSFLLDLGAGCLSLSELIPSQTHYIPSDIIARPQLQHHEHFPKVIDCDYNSGLLPVAPAGDANGMVVAMGVVEYMCDPLAFLRGLQTYELPLVLSYAPVDQPLPPGIPNVRANTLTQGQWQDLLQQAGFGKPTLEARIVAGGVVNKMYLFHPAPTWGWHAGASWVAAANATAPAPRLRAAAGGRAA